MNALPLMLLPLPVNVAALAMGVTKDLLLFYSPHALPLVRVSCRESTLRPGATAPYLCHGASAPYTLAHAHRMPWRMLHRIRPNIMALVHRTSWRNCTASHGAIAPYTLWRLRRVSWRTCTVCPTVTRGGRDTLCNYRLLTVDPAGGVSWVQYRIWCCCCSVTPWPDARSHALARTHRTSWRNCTACHDATAPYTLAQMRRMPWRTLHRILYVLAPWRACTERPGATAPHVMAQLHRMRTMASTHRMSWVARNV